jgi:hypothetical protein
MWPLTGTGRGRSGSSAGRFVIRGHRIDAPLSRRDRSVPLVARTGLSGSYDLLASSSRALSHRV